MSSKWLHVLLVLLAANGISTAAPEAPNRKAVPSPAEVLAPDSRLQRRVTLHGVGVPVKELLQRLSGATGARLSATEEVGERPIIVLVDEVPAGKVLAVLCELFHYRVRSFGVAEAPPERRRYQLVRPQSDREEEARLKRLDLQAFRKRMAAYTRMASLEDEALAAAGTELRDIVGPDLQSLSYHGSPGVRRLPLVLSALDEAQTQALYDGRWVILRPNELPDPVRPVILHSLGNQLLFRTCRDSGYFVEHSTEALPPIALEKSVVALKADPEVAGTDHELRVVLRGFDLQRVPEQFDISRSVPFSRVEMGFGGRGAGAGVFDYSPARVTQNRKEREALGLRLQPPLELRTPELAKRLPLPEPVTQPLMFWELHRFTGAPILSDYGYRIGWRFGPEAGASLGEAIDYLQEAFRLRWKVADGLHTFRSTGWYAEDALTVRPDLLRRWAAEAREGKAYSVATLQEMAALSQSQLRRVVDYGLLPGLSWLLEHPDELASLRLLALATSQQKRALATGLPVEALTEAQQEALLDSDHLTPSDWKAVRLEVGPRGDLTFIYLDEAQGRRQVSIGPLPAQGHPGQDVTATDLPDLAWAVTHPEPRHASEAPSAERTAGSGPGPR